MIARTRKAQGDDMIELLGVGVEGGREGWLLHRVCTRLASSQVTALVSSQAEERWAMLDVLGARRVPGEGRTWIEGAPLGRDTAHRLRERIAEVALGVELAEGRSVLWNTLATGAGGRLRAFLRLPRPGVRQAADRALRTVGLGEMARARVAGLDAEGQLRIAVARALAAEPSVLLVRDPDVALPSADAARLMKMLRVLSRSERVTVVASLDRPELAQAFADRLLVIADGALVFDGAPATFTSSRAPARLSLVQG